MKLDAGVVAEGRFGLAVCLAMRRFQASCTSATWSASPGLRRLSSSASASPEDWGGLASAVVVVDVAAVVADEGLPLGCLRDQSKSFL